MRTDGVLSLRTALRRAERAGARVEHVHRAGELRVEAPGRPPLIVSARRKDETPELHKLIVELEATDQAPERKVRRPPADSLVARVLAWVAEAPDIGDEWRHWPGSGRVAAELGDADGTQVAVALNNLQRAGRIEWQRNPPGPRGKPGYIRAVRVLTGPQPIYLPTARPAEPSEPRPPKFATGILPTPKLAAYAEARKLAAAHPMLRADPAPGDLADILAEAVRLYHWLRK